MKSRKAIQTILYLAMSAAFFVFGCSQSNPISSDRQIEDAVVEQYDLGEEGRQAGTVAVGVELVPDIKDQ